MSKSIVRVYIACLRDDLAIRLYPHSDWLHEINVVMLGGYDGYNIKLIEFIKRKDRTNK